MAMLQACIAGWLVIGPGLARIVLPIGFQILKYLFVFNIFVYHIHSINSGVEPWSVPFEVDCAGANFLKPKANKTFHQCKPTTYYYSLAVARTLAPREGRAGVL